MTSLKGQTALVTGASGGIGGACAVELAKCGADVLVNYHSDKAGAEEVLKAIEQEGRKALLFGADVSQAKDVHDMVEKAEKELGVITIVVHAAAPELSLKSFENTAWDDFEKQWRVGVCGAYNVLRAVFPGMKEKKYGRIVMVLSAYLFEEKPQKVAPYVTAKEALWGLTKAAAADFAPFGISVNALSPAFTDTKMTQKAFPARYKELVARAAPSGKVLTPQEVAREITPLLDPESKVTGTNVRIGEV